MLSRLESWNPVKGSHYNGALRRTFRLLPPSVGPKFLGTKITRPAERGSLNNFMTDGGSPVADYLFIVRAVKGRTNHARTPGLMVLLIAVR